MSDPLVNEPLIERRSAPVFDVGVVLERTFREFGSATSARMKVPVWSLRELVVRGQLEESPTAAPKMVLNKTVIQDSADSLHVLWTGLQLAFYRDGGESYWHTLVGNQQEMFVVCQDDEEGEFTPVLVTADYDEAMAYQEADDSIFSAPMPEKIYRVVERFVLENYAPTAKKRRKRKNWHGEESDQAFARKPNV